MFRRSGTRLSSAKYVTSVDRKKTPDAATSPSGPGGSKRPTRLDVTVIFSHSHCFICLFIYLFIYSFEITAKRARKSSQAYVRNYGEVQPVSQLIKETAGVMQEYTQRGGVRPFGISLLVAGLDGDGSPHLYQVDPSGAYFAWKATAIGKNYASAKNFLEKRWTTDMELEDAIHTALLTLREGFEGEMTADNIEVGVVKKDGKFQVLTPAQIQDYLDEAN